MLPCYRPEPILSSLSSPTAGRGKSSVCLSPSPPAVLELPRLPEKSCSKWHFTKQVTHPEPKAGERRKENQLSPQDCTHLQHEGSLKEHNLATWQRQRQEMGAAEGMCWDLGSGQGWAMLSLLRRCCCSCGRLSWHHQSPWVAHMCKHLLLYICCLQFCRAQNPRKKGKWRELKLIPQLTSQRYS